MEKIIIRREKNGILKLTLNDPKNLNALSEKLLDEINISLKNLKKDRKTKVLIIDSSTN